MYPYAPGSTVAERMAQRAVDGYFIAPHDVINENSRHKCILIPPSLTELYLHHADPDDRAIAKFLRTIGAYTPNDFRRFAKQSDLAFYFAAARFVYVHRGQLEHLTSIERIYTRHKERIFKEIDVLLTGFLHCAHAHNVELRIHALFPFAARLCEIDHPQFMVHANQRSIATFLIDPHHHVTGRDRLGPRFEQYVDTLFRGEEQRHYHELSAQIERRLGGGYLIDVDAHHRLKAAVRRTQGKSPDYLHFGRRICALDLKATLDHVNPVQISKENTQRILLTCSEELEPIYRIAA